MYGQERRVGMAGLSSQIGLINVAAIEFSRLFDENSRMIAVTSRLLKHDPATVIHNFQTFFLACDIGETMGLSPENMIRVARGAFLHDVGKLGVDERVINKNGKLTPDEKSQMNDHMPIGAEVLTAAGLESYVPFALEHHIGNSSSLHNGEGGLRSEPLSDIVSVADKIAASRDPWREYHNGNLASIQELRQAIDAGEGKYFRKETVEALRKIPDERIPPFDNWFDGELLRYVDKYLDIRLYAKTFSNKKILRLLLEKNPAKMI